MVIRILRLDNHCVVDPAHSQATLAVDVDPENFPILAELDLDRAVWCGDVEHAVIISGLFGHEEPPR
jgi:hypothetical protein